MRLVRLFLKLSHLLAKDWHTRICCVHNPWPKANQTERHGYGMQIWIRIHVLNFTPNFKEKKNTLFQRGYIFFAEMFHYQPRNSDPNFFVNAGWWIRIRIYSPAFQWLFFRFLLFIPFLGSLSWGASAPLPQQATAPAAASRGIPQQQQQQQPPPAAQQQPPPSTHVRLLVMLSSLGLSGPWNHDCRAESRCF